MSELTIQELLKKRHSGREYDTSKNLSSGEVKTWLASAHFAPSCYNDQPWRFILAHRDEHPEAYRNIFESLVAFNQGWTKDVPLLVVLVASMVFNQNEKPNRWGPYDTGSAAFSLMLVAEAKGCMAHQMGGFDEKKITQAFAIPDHFSPMSVMAIGYEKEGLTVPEKERRPLNKHFFWGTFEA